MKEAKLESIESLLLYGIKFIYYKLFIILEYIWWMLRSTPYAFVITIL